MKELQQIIQGYEKSKTRNQSTALATVVKVDGSAYRRPGARMLVTEDGELTGAISGGCLEGDALRKAQSVIFQQRSMVVTYDTTDEDDQKFGVGLGCNGIIQVLIEPIDINDKENPVELLKTALSERQSSNLVTIFSLKNSRSEQIGTKILKKGKIIHGSLEKIENGLLNQIHDELTYNIDKQSNIIINYSEHDDVFVFYESIKPPVQIFLFGAGNDTIPLAKMAAILGWQIQLIDGRKNHATKERFPDASTIITGSPSEVVQHLQPDSNSVALLMTHNFEYELEVLGHLISYNLPYVGILGPKKKTEKLISRLSEKGIKISTENIYAPTGLNLGAEGSEEIALSVLAEIKAVLNNKKPFFLRDKSGPIHEEEL
ncbi:XdhC family protein [Aquiflexum sp.]|uniref:XdhC family protein n=1 Tax=Aquiflexum sp. TaxID=1872584 RepID=UPI003593DDA6